MTDQAMVAAQPFPPGKSRLERLPDELKLRIGDFLTASTTIRITKPKVLAHPHSTSIFSTNRALLCYRQRFNQPTIQVKRADSNASVLALASTSTRLCSIFLIEHAKKYGLQNTLYRSIQLGNINLIQRALDYGADINKAGTRTPWVVTPLQLAVQSKQLPVILYLLRRGVDKADELVMYILREKAYREQCLEYNGGLAWRRTHLRNHCLCNLLHSLMDATLGGSQASHASGPRLPRETLEALAPNGRHLWFILRTCMLRHWGCDCDGEPDGEGCPMRLVSLLRRCGATWMPCGIDEDAPRAAGRLFSLGDIRASIWRMFVRHPCDGRGAVDRRRLDSPLPHFGLYPDSNDPKLVGPSVAGAMDEALLERTAYRRDHCVPFVVAMLEHGVTAEQGDLSCAMDLSSRPGHKRLSLAIVVALLRAGTDPNEPGAMNTALRLACMDNTKDAALAFVTLLLEHGADPGAAWLQDEVQSAAEKWWVQSVWQSSGVFCRILRLLVEGGLDEHVACEIRAVLGLDHDLVAGESGGSAEL